MLGSLSPAAQIESLGICEWFCADSQNLTVTSIHIEFISQIKRGHDEVKQSVGEVAGNADGLVISNVGVNDRAMEGLILRQFDRVIHG